MGKSLKIRLLLGVFILLTSSGSSAQDITMEGVPGVIISPGYTAHIPIGDLSDRFGFYNSVGGFLGYKLKSNWIFGAEGVMTFSSNVKEQSMLDPLLDEDGLLFGNGGNPENYEFLHRGMNLQLKAGKIFDLFGPNPNSGLFVQFGAGYWQHKVIIDVQDNLFPNLAGDYRQGYDRFTSGVSLSQFIGYLHLSNRNFFNFYVGLEFMQGITQGRRNYQFDLMAPLNDNRFDGAIGLKIGWIIPVYPEGATDFHMY